MKRATASETSVSPDGQSMPLDDRLIEAVAEVVRQTIQESSRPLFVDAKAAGALLDVPASWLMQEARAGRVPHVKFGHYTRFDPEQLRAWAEARMRGPRR